MHVNLFDFAKKNILRDFKTYTYYFLNCIFSVFIFFLFSVLSFHPNLKVIDSNSTLGLILVLSQFISILFSMIFISYSVTNFLKNRNKQFGLITIIGASKKQLNKIIFWENLIIGFMAIVSGILLGLIFSKLFLTVAAKLIQGIELNFYLPIKAILLTAIVLGIVFILIALITPHFIRKQKIINLLKQEDKSENLRNLKYIIPLFIICLIVAILFHKYADNSNLLSVLVLFLDLIILISGSYLILSIILNLYIFINKKTGRYYQNTNMLAISNIKNSIRSTLQTMTLSTVLYAISLLCIIFMVASAGNVEEQTRKIVPQTFLYMPWTSNAPVANDTAIIEAKINKLAGYRKLESTLYYPEGNNRDALMTESEYNKIAQFLNYEKISLNDNQVYLVSGNNKTALQDIPSPIESILDKSAQLNLKGSSNRIIALSGLFNSITVMPDSVVKSIITKVQKQNIFSYNIDNWTNYNNISEDIKISIDDTLQNRSATFISATHYYETDRLTKNLILYVGSIMCFSFLLAIASFIYSKLYSNIEKDCEKYKNLVKLGLSKKELFKILTFLVKTILFLPFGLAIIYMWVGVLFVEKYIIVSNIPIAIKYTIIYAVLQTIIYIAIKKSYQKNIEKGVYQN